MKTARLTISAITLPLASSAFAADANLDSPASGAPKTRAQVAAEVQQAIANGEIRRGPLADIYESAANVQTAPAQIQTASRDKPVPDQTKRQSQAGKPNLN